LPPGPLRNVPRLRRRIALAMSLVAERLYFCPLAFFFPPDFFLAAIASPVNEDVDNRICFATHGKVRESHGASVWARAERAKRALLMRVMLERGA
jgi:hypothetical protein